MVLSDWKIIYTKYEGMTKKSVNLISKEAGGLMVRETGVYRIHVLPCEKEGSAISKNAFRAKTWRIYSADWMVYGELAINMMQCIKENKLKDIDIGVAGTLDGGIYLPLALYAQMFRNCDVEYNDILKKTARRACITVD